MHANRQRVIENSELSQALINSVRQKIVLMPALQPLNTEQIDNINLALSEHLTNIHRHNTEPCTVTIDVITKPKAISITDTGADISNLLSEITQEAAVPDPLSESGRGLWLIKQCFPNLHYETNNGHNTLLLPLAAAKALIAVIDDDPIQLSLLSVWLEADYRLITFEDPLKALSFLATQTVDLIICDIKMPGLDGLSLRQRLLASGRNQTVPFLFLSALDDESLINRAAELAIDDFITKPIREAPLKASIKRVLQRNSQLTQSVDVQLDKAITSSLWHRLPATWGGWTLDLSYLVASRGGGDFVFVQQRSKSLLIILGDVMGHGTDAKFFAFAISGYLHGLCYALSRDHSPADLMQKLSNALSNNTILQQTLVTALVIELFEDGTLTLACAGHPAPFFASTSTGFQQLNIGGVLPGLQQDAIYEQTHIQCQSGETLLAYTDGLTEQFPQQQFTEHNVLNHKLAVLCLSPKTLNLHEFLHNNTTQPLPDDVTLLGIRRS